MIRALNKYCADMQSWDIPSGGVFIWLKVVHNIPDEKTIFRGTIKRNSLTRAYYEEESDQSNIRLSYGYASPEHDYGINCSGKLIGS